MKSVKIVVKLVLAMFWWVFSVQYWLVNYVSYLCIRSSLVPRLFHWKEPGTDCLRMLHLPHFSWATGYFSAHVCDSYDVIVTGYTRQEQWRRLWTLLHVPSCCNAWCLLSSWRSKSSERYWRTAMHVNVLHNLPIPILAYTYNIGTYTDTDTSIGTTLI